MNYVGIRRGQHMPITGIAQKLLNRHGAGLTVDGAFGRKTWHAVRDFQRLHGIGVDGVIGRNTWPRLVDGLPIAVGDAVDDWEKGTPGNDGFETPHLNAIGADFYRSPKVSGKAAIAVDGMLQHYRGCNLSLLRLHGHGSPGVVTVVGGLQGNHWFSKLNPWLLDCPVAEQELARFSEIMGPMGSISLNGCRTGKGVHGSQLLEMMARMTGFPVVAALQTQLAGPKSTFFMEGPVKVRFPDPRMTLRDWCDALPDFPQKIQSGTGAIPPLQRMHESRPAF
ncbi:MAG: peptidoglycan-binding protein [Pseudomonadota bacterium]